MGGAHDEFNFGVNVDEVNALEVVVTGGIAFPGGDVGRARQKFAHERVVDSCDILSVKGFKTEVDEFSILGVVIVHGAYG